MIGIVFSVMFERKSSVQNAVLLLMCGTTVKYAVNAVGVNSEMIKNEILSTL